MLIFLLHYRLTIGAVKYRLDDIQNRHCTVRKILRRVHCTDIARVRSTVDCVWDVTYAVQNVYLNNDVEEIISLTFITYRISEGGNEIASVCPSARPFLSTLWRLEPT